MAPILQADHAKVQLSCALRLSRRAICLAALASLAACVTPGSPTCADGMQQMKSELLYFGRSSPSGPVSDQQWTAFVEQHVTPRFPQGLSVWEAAGQWQSAAGEISHEASYVLNIVHPGTAEHERDLRTIVAEYREAFQQEAVLRTQSAVCVAL